MMVFVLSFLFVSLLCGAVLARNSSIIFSEFRSFSSSSSLSTCLSCFAFFCCLTLAFKTYFVEVALPLGTEKEKREEQRRDREFSLSEIKMRPLGALKFHYLLLFD